VSITLYALLVVRRYSPGDISGGLFSALFIQVHLDLVLASAAGTCNSHTHIHMHTAHTTQVKTFEYEPIEDLIEDIPVRALPLALDTPSLRS
jgi:hypothetical protein